MKEEALKNKNKALDAEIKNNQSRKEEHPLDFITPTELSKKVEFAEKEKTNLDLCRRTLDQLVKKRLVQKEKGSGDKNSIENRYRKLH